VLPDNHPSVAVDQGNLTLVGFHQDSQNLAVVQWDILILDNHLVELQGNLLQVAEHQDNHLQNN
jgi:hypothetical protein